MSEKYELKKWVWTEVDFEGMDWHDSRIHALAFLPDEFEIVFDVDYILQWIHPESDEVRFQFWIAPATLVFENVYDLEFEIKSFNGGLEIDNIRREDERLPRNAQHIGREAEWQWVMEFQEGEIKFRSAGYKQYIRDSPVLGENQTLELKSRGISFIRGKIE